MKRFKKILLVVSCQESDKLSLRRAVDLAQRNKASLSLMHVIEAPVGRISALSNQIRGLKLAKLIIDDRKTEIKKLLKTVNVSKSQIDIVIGVPFIEIIRHVHKNGFDLVMMTSEGKGTVKEKLFGATSLHLMRKCPCPVWIVKPVQSTRYKTILASVDPMDSDPVKNALNKKILELATSMAELEKGELHLVHVWDFVWESLLVRRAKISQNDVKIAVEEVKENHRKALEELAEKHPPKTIKRKCHLLKGTPGIVIPKCAEKIRADLIVMGTVSRQGISGLLIGNTAEQVLQKVSASALTVKPEGFVSPIQ